MRRNQKLGFPGLGHSRRVINKELRLARQELRAIELFGSRLKGRATIKRSTERKIADLTEGLKALQGWSMAEIDEG